MDGSVVAGDLIAALRESALLANVTIGVWRAEQTNKKALEKLKADAGATGDVGRLLINRLAGADEKYKEMVAEFSKVRTLHNSMTLPWVSDPSAERATGSRLLPHLLFQQYLTAVGAQKTKAFKALDEFMVLYPGCVVRAQAQLAGLAEAVYPDVDEVRARFRVHFDFEPIPEGASFKGLPEFTTERLAKGLEQRQSRMLAEAQKAMWDTVKERVGHIVERLGDPENRFKEATLENTKELLTLLPGWNLAGDPHIGHVVNEIKTMLDGVDGKLIRDNPTVRKEVADKAKDLLGRMQVWGV